MTGNRPKACDVVRDTLRLAARDIDSTFSKEQARLWLYRTARSKLLKDWHASTTKLEEELIPSRTSELNRREFQKVSELIRSFSGPIREVLLLSDRLKFDHNEVATIMGIPISEVKASYHAAQAKLSLLFPNDKQRQTELIQTLPHYTEGLYSGEASNVAELMEGVKIRVQTKIRIMFAVKVALIVTLIVLLTMVIFRPNLITDLFIQ
jgi:DNA-directed RNA polymerase specialized sigma24 family protein